MKIKTLNKIVIETCSLNKNKSLITISNTYEGKSIDFTVERKMDDIEIDIEIDTENQTQISLDELISVGINTDEIYFYGRDTKVVSSLYISPKGRPERFEITVDDFVLGDTDTIGE